jgi:hypothetical protein
VVFVELAAEVGPEDEDQLVEEGEDEGAVDVLLRGGEQVDVAAPHVKQRGAADARDGRTHFLGVDDLQTKRVRHATTEAESAMSEWREETSIRRRSGKR